MAEPPAAEPAGVAVAVGLADLVRTIVRLHPRELSLTAEGVLTTIERAGPLRIADLVASAGVSQPAMTELVTRLERDGHVCRERDPGDGRAVLVRLTETGRDRMAGRRAETARRLSELLGQLDGAEQAALRAALPAIARLQDLEAGRILRPA